MGGRTSNESKAKYNAKVYDRINIAVPKGYKEKVQAAAAANGQTVNAFVKGLIVSALETSARSVKVGDSQEQPDTQQA